MLQLNAVAKSELGIPGDRDLVPLLLLLLLLLLPSIGRIERPFGGGAGGFVSISARAFW